MPERCWSAKELVYESVQYGPARSRHDSLPPRLGSNK